MADARREHEADFAGWVYPAPIWTDEKGRERRPVISSGFRTTSRPKHDGVDLSYRSLEGDPPYPGHYTEERSPNFRTPADLPQLAAGPGRVWDFGESPTGKGFWVRIDHGPAGFPFNTIYRHMPTRPIVSKGQDVLAGQVIGMIGGGTVPPAFRHVHFELLDFRPGKKGRPIDPRPFMAGWQVLRVGDPPLQPKRPLVATREGGPKPEEKGSALLPVLGLLAGTFLAAWVLA